MTLNEKTGPMSTAAMREGLKRLEVDLADQGVALFASTAVGHRAYVLWRRLRQHLLHGGSVQITPSALGLTWHRQELKRARDVLVEMGLGRYDPLDELARERFLEVKLVEGVLAALGGLMGKSNTRKWS
jgi:hypothetical protein